MEKSQHTDFNDNDAFEEKGLLNILQVSWTAKKTHKWVLNKAEVKRELLTQSKQGTRRRNNEVTWKRDNARNNARCTQAMKAAHGLDGQHLYVDRTPRGRVSQNLKGQR